MRSLWSRFGIAAVVALGGADSAWALSDHIMTVTTMTFTMPVKMTDVCRKRVMAVTVQAEATAALNDCKIPFKLDTYSQLRSKTPVEEWGAMLADAPIGKIAIRQNGNDFTYFIVHNERVVGMASISNTLPIRRVIYEGVLDAAMQKELGPIHDMDGVIRVLTAHKVRFVEDSGTLFAGSVPDVVSQALIDHPGDPYVIQRKDSGVIYARRTAPKP